jgi:hypothetical protein
MAVTAERLKFWLGEIDGHAMEASEYAQMASSAVKSACKEMTTDRAIIALARKVRKMDESRRSAYVYQVVQLFDALGCFDQRDILSDSIELMRGIVEREPAAPTPVADTLDDFDNNAASLHDLNPVTTKRSRGKKQPEPA